MKRGRMRLPKWEFYTVHMIEPDGSCRLLTSYVDDTHYSYLGWWVPGSPQVGDIVGSRDGNKRWGIPPRVRVAGREYDFIAPGPVYRAVDTGEIISRWDAPGERA